MKKTTLALAFLLLVSGRLMAQTAAPAPASTVVYSQPSAADTYVAANAGATLVKAESGKLTFKKPNGSYQLMSGKGLTYQQNGKWVPTKLQVAALSDGSGWVLQGVGINATFASTDHADKDISIKSGSLIFNIHAPKLVHNGDNTFTFNEAGTNWLVQAAANSVTMQTTVTKRIGKGAGKHIFGYESAGSAATIAATTNGDVSVSDTIHMTRPVIIGADKKPYTACSAWAIDAGTLSFTCDDSILPDGAIPYVIDPWLTTGPEGDNSGYNQVGAANSDCCWDGLNWSHTWWGVDFDISSIPPDAIVSSVSVDSSALRAGWAPVYSPDSVCTQDAGTWSAWPGGAPGDMQAIPGRTDLRWSITFSLGWYADDTEYGCRGGVSGGDSLTLSVGYAVSPPTISSVSPGSGPAGTSVTITGTQFGEIQGQSQVSVCWGYAAITSWSATTIVARIPQLSYSPCSVVVAQWDGEGNQDTSNALNFTITGPQSITGLSPTAGPVGTAVTITGIGFGSIPGTVTFNGTSATPTSWSDTSIHVPVPSGAASGNVVVTVSNLPSYGAVFTVNPATVSFTIAGNTGGGYIAVVVDGTSYAAPHTFQWYPGTGHTIATTATQAGATGIQYAFANWSDGGALSHGITAPSSATTYTANFKMQYNLWTTAGAGGVIAPSSGGWYDGFSVVAISATANAGYRFTGFTGAVTATTSPQNLTMTAPSGVVANFVALTTVTVAASQTGASFSVDGATYTSAQTFTWLAGDTHAIATTATQAGPAGTQSVWTGWSDGGALSHNITVPALATAYTAGFKTQYYLTTLAGAGGSIAPSSGWYDAGSTVAVGGTANSGYRFSGFGGNLSGVTTPQNMTMSAAESVTASFAQVPTVAITVSTGQLGTSFSVDGATYTSAQIFNWPVNDWHTIAAAATQAGGAGTQYVWTGWSDGGAISHAINVVGPISYTAAFSPQYYLTALVSPPGSGTIAPASGWYNGGAYFVMSEQANTGYQFSGFSPANAGVGMNGPVTMTANFVPFTGQTIASNPPGASLTVDGTGCTAPCSFQWAAGANHTIATATQSPGSGTQLVWSNWSDGGGISHTIAASAGATYTANFATQYYLTTSANPVTGGSISPPSGWYNSGQVVQVSAVPNTGYPFGGFGGGVTGVANPQYLTMAGPSNVTANFTNALTVAPNQPSPRVVIPRNTTGVVANFAFSSGDAMSLLGQDCNTDDPNVFVTIYELQPALMAIRYYFLQVPAPGQDNVTEVTASCACLYDVCLTVLPPVDVEPAPTLHVLYNGSDVTGTTQPQSALVGQWVDLVAQVADGPTPIFQWQQPPGNTATRWVDGGNSSQPPTPISPATLQTSEIAFAWTDTTANNGSTGALVKVSATLPDGTVLSTSVPFNIALPLIAGSASETGVHVGNDCPNMTDYRMCLAENGPGIVFVPLQQPSQANACTGSGYNCEWIQVVNGATIDYTSPSGSVCESSTSGMDNNGHRVPSSLGVANDSPGIPLPNNYREATASESFSMFLMFKPATPNSLWVPLWEIDWSWFGDAYIISASPNTWSVKNSFPPVGSNLSLPGHAVSSYPAWNSIADTGAPCNTPPAVSTISVVPQTLSPGASAAITITLNQSAPALGTNVSLASSDPAFTVQQTCTVPPNTTTSQNCTGTANAVDSPTTLVVTASYYNSTQSTNVTVVPHQ